MITDVEALKKDIENIAFNEQGHCDLDDIIDAIDVANKKPVISKECEQVVRDFFDISNSEINKSFYIFDVASSFMNGALINENFDNWLRLSHSNKKAFIEAILSGEWEVEQEKYKVGDYYYLKTGELFKIETIKNTEYIGISVNFEKELYKNHMYTDFYLERLATQEEINIFKAAEMYRDHDRSYGDLRLGDIVQNEESDNPIFILSDERVENFKNRIMKETTKLLMTKEEFERACEEEK